MSGWFKLDFVDAQAFMVGNMMGVMDKKKYL